MLKTFIDRPVLSTVISIIIVMLGILGLISLPVTQYPDIAPPTISVTTSFPGANAQTILESVVIPIEEQINGVEGMDYLTSTASNDGSATITVYFKQGIDPDIAAVNVQNRVSRANALLPAEVLQNGVITQKQQTSALMYFSFFTTNPDYDATFIQNYLNINVIPELKRINGVGAVNVFGDKNYAIRVWLRPEMLASFNLVPGDVVRALNEQSLEAAAGALGQNSGTAFEYVLNYKGRYKTEIEYENIIVRALGNNQFIRLKDVADIELDAFSYSTVSKTNTYPAVNAGIFQTAGSNAQEIVTAIKAKFDELEPTFPAGTEYVINYNVDDFLTASIDGVIDTLIEAFILVFIVVFIFLQNFRSTLIPGIAVPVSIVGTFFFLNLMGYSLNLLTLFAMVLAIGIVVDDAIVVVEAVEAKLAGGAKSPRKATHSAMDEIYGAIITTSLVMVAVYVPVTFMTGPTGIFYEQFGVTLIIAILISTVNALTLSPALCALLLKPEGDENGKLSLMQRLSRAFNAGFDAITNRYGRSIRFLRRHWWISLAILIGAGYSVYYFNGKIPTGFVPTEDRGVIFVNAELPAGASLDRTVAVMDELYEKAKKIPGIENISFIAGRNFFSGNGGSYSLGFLTLKPWEERLENPALSINAIIGQLFGVASTIKDGRFVFFQPPQIPGFGSSDGFSVVVQDRTGGNFNDLDKNVSDFVGQVMQRPEVLFANNGFSTEFPQYEMELNIPRIKAANLQVSDVLGVMQGYIGGIYASNFSRFGKQYRVYVQSPPIYREVKEDLNQLFVKTANNEMAPVSQFLSLKRVYGPQSVNRFNLFNAVTVNGAATPGFSSGDAVAAVNEVAQSLPDGYSLDYSGLTREENNSASQTTLIFLLSLLFVYLLLSAQYESYLIPFAVLLSLPVGIGGAYLTTFLLGQENNIYFQISLVMLVGLLAKNAILIVEFAMQARKNGSSILEAAVEGSKVRLRPILMTSLAFVAGLMPLVVSTGIGAIGNRSIGTGAAGGVFIGTFLGIFVIPILYIIFQSAQEFFTKKPIED